MTARERPILFSAPMVRAILTGNKTQTRRVVNLNRHYQIEERDDGSLWPWMYDDDRTSDSWLACPYGMPGDRLWVRETFCDDWKDSRGIQYRADGGLDGDMTDAGCTWRPSIFMPRSASRGRRHRGHAWLVDARRAAMERPRTESPLWRYAHRQLPRAVGIHQRPRIVGREPLGMGNQF